MATTDNHIDVTEESSTEARSRKNSVKDSGEKIISYSAEKIVGNGSFGIVFKATVTQTGETVAIKKVLQDKRFKNRELQIMKLLSHPNVIELKHCFYSSGKDSSERYLNLVLAYVPDTVYQVTREYTKAKQSVPLLIVKLYVYQICRSLAYIHSLGICHRDIKPQNLLVNEATHELVLCDFGSAKKLVRGEPNVAYICSRYYRAPELIFGATDYTTAIDIWSVGCVMAELLLGHPIFPGESGVDQLVEIIKVLGTPTREEIHAMNPNYTEFKFPQIKAHSWGKVLKNRGNSEAIDLVSRMLQYRPDRRILPFEAMAHPFFDELRDPNTWLPNGGQLPPLFNFTRAEQSLHGEIIPRLLPRGMVLPSTSPSRKSSGTTDGTAAAGTSLPPADGRSRGGGSGSGSNSGRLGLGDKMRDRKRSSPSSRGGSRRGKSGTDDAQAQ